MRVLGIECSCDECSLAIVEDGKIIRGMKTYSQLEEHRDFGGVVPELASRVHVKHIGVLYKHLLVETHIDADQAERSIDGIACTVCPGLKGSLIVGLQFAKGLALALHKPLIGIDHILAHFYSGTMDTDISYPYIGLVVSGGHTLIGVVEDYDTVHIKGYTIDDACGEAYEKVARELDLGYPGGPSIDTLAQSGDIHAACFPVYRDTKHIYNFSYSGLKTAVIHHRAKFWNTHIPETKENIAAAFQHAAITMILDRITLLMQETGIARVCVGGGVACNSYLRNNLEQLKRAGTIHTLAMPRSALCVDNGAMIAGLGYEYLTRGITSDFNIDVRSRNYFYRNTT